MYLKRRQRKKNCVEQRKESDTKSPRRWAEVSPLRYTKLLPLFMRLLSWLQISPEPWILRCMADYCGAAKMEGEANLNKAVCTIFTIFAQQCAEYGPRISWRRTDFCRKFTNVNTPLPKAIALLLFLHQLFVEGKNDCSLPAIGIYHAKPTTSLFLTL